MIKSNYPHWVCNQCGWVASFATQITRGKQPDKTEVAFKLSTYHVDNCEVCGKETWVTEARDFFYPDFELINAKELRKAYEKYAEGKGRRKVERTI